MTVRYLTGDVRDVLATIPDGSVDLVLTSPPFLALRSYLPADHPDKGREIGSEATPAAFLDTLLDLTAEWARVLAPHGSIAVELGDTYSSSGGITDNRVSSLGGNDFAPRAARGGGSGWPLDKSLCMIPQLYAASLAYGRNLLTGREIDPWRVRNVVRWCRPNPPVGALGDKFRPATSEMTVATKARDRYFDLDAVREPHKNGVDPATMGGNGYGYRAPAEHGNGTVSMPGNAAGAPPLDWWEISTQPYKGSHYATWPERLCVRPILAMCPERVCTTCGQPSRRIAETTNAVGQAVQRTAHRESPDGAGDGRVGVMDVNDAPDYSERRTIGWTDCGCRTWRRGVVLDPFAGSGTTLVVAHRLGRDAIGIDLDGRNAELYEQRIAQHEGGLFLDAPAEPAWIDVELPL